MSQTKDLTLAKDKLGNIDDKMAFIVNMVAYLNVDDFPLKSKDMNGFSAILEDIQKEIKEVKESLI